MLHSFSFKPGIRLFPNGEVISNFKNSSQKW